MENPYIPLEFQEHDLIKTAKTFWLFSPGLHGWGWALPIYFDRTSDVYRVFNCPTFGTTYETQELPPDGILEIELETPWQYAKNTFTNVMKVNVR